MHNYVHCIKCNGQDMVTTQMPNLNGWIKKLWYIYTIYIYIFAICNSKKKQTCVICCHMDETRKYHAKCSESEGKVYTQNDLTHYVGIKDKHQGFQMIV